MPDSTLNIFPMFLTFTESNIGSLTNIPNIIQLINCEAGFKLKYVRFPYLFLLH